MKSIPLCPSSYLRPGSKFHGTQQSERQVYDVQVEIKHVDMRESFLCGYLRIQGKTKAILSFSSPSLLTCVSNVQGSRKITLHSQHILKAKSLEPSITSLHNTKIGAQLPKSTLVTGLSLVHFVHTRNKLGKARSRYPT